MVLEQMTQVTPAQAASSDLSSAPRGAFDFLRPLDDEPGGVIGESKLASPVYGDEGTNTEGLTLRFRTRSTGRPWTCSAVVSSVMGSMVKADSL